MSDFFFSGSDVWKIPIFWSDVKRRLQFFSIFYGSESININLTKQTSRSGFIGHLNDLWIFCPISWKQGLKLKPIWHCNNNNTPVYCTLCFSCSYDFFDRLPAENFKLGLFWTLFKSVGLCQVRELPQFHLEDDGTISLLSWKLIPRV